MTVPIDVDPWVALALSYVMGSIPFAFLAGKANGVDLRSVGSGNLGATNVMRTLGWKWAAPVFLADALKGGIPAGLFPWFINTQHSDYWAVAYGVAAITGHAKPIFLLFRGGGKGVATSAGVFLALTPKATVAALVVFAVTVKLTGFVSLGSLLAALVLPVGVALTQGVGSLFFWPSLALAAFLFWSHRANIGRLRRGEEQGFKKKAEGSA